MKLFGGKVGGSSATGKIPSRVYIVSLAMIGLLLGVYFACVQPRNKAMAAARAETQNRRVALQLFETEMAKLQSTRERLAKLQKAVDDFESHLPQQGEIDVILREVWVIADAAGLKTQRIKTLKEKEQDFCKVLPIEMNLAGQFAGVYTFMLSLDKLPGTMKVESLRVAAVENEPAGTVEASLVLNVFCRK